MTIAYGSRILRLNDPTPEQIFHETTGAMPRMEAEAFLAGFRAGAEATLRQIENSRGARMEAALLETYRE
ncbi:MAG TPA: hypothetical protein VGB45_05200 [Abditibacterium sp.]|jgi:hypothetical protein